MSINEPLLATAARPARSFAFYLGLAGWNLGMSFAFSASFVTITPLLQSLGLSYSLSALFWLAGPLSGLIVQPLVGAWSDRVRSRFGRRRVFYVAAGLPLTVIGMGFLGSAVELGRLLGDTDTAHSNASSIALASLWSAFVGLNVVGIVGFALQLDLCEGELEAARATSAITTMGAVGNVAATALGFVDLTRVVPVASNGQALLYIGLVVFVIASLSTLVLGKEAPLERRPAPLPASLGAVVARVRAVPRFFWSICVVY